MTLVTEPIPTTLQGIFDRVSVHLLTQKNKSEGFHPVEGDVRCMYRGPNGRMCAIGCLIPDDAYKASLEFCDPPEFLGQVNLDVLSEFEFELSQLQALHDHWPVSEWRSRLSEFALEYRLTTAAMDAVL